MRKGSAEAVRKQCGSSAEAVRRQGGVESGLRRHVQCEEIHTYRVQISVNKTETVAFRVNIHIHINSSTRVYTLNIILYTE